jgi:predicted porin
MKKTLVAIAALASVSAFAQSTVTITGLIDMNYGSVTAPKNSAGLSTGNISRVAHNGDATTAIVLQATDDIGGGLTAAFRYEINPDFVNGTGLTGGAGVGNAANAQTNDAATSTQTVAYGNGANGYNFIGLSSKDMGGIKLGRLNTGTLTAWLDGSVFGTALGSGFGSSAIYTRYSSSTANYNNSAPVRFNNAVEYQSPAMNGFTVRYLYSPQVDVNGIGGENGCTVAASCLVANTTSVGANRAGSSDLSLRYSNGPLNASYAMQQIKSGSGDTSSLVNPAGQTTANAKVNHSTMAANYTVGNITGYVAYWTLTHLTAAAATEINDKGNMFGIKYTMGNIELKASQAKLNSSLTGTSSLQADRKVTGFGADYNLSKKSKIYVRMENRNADTNGTVTTSGSATATVGAATKTNVIGFRTNF